MNLIDKARLLIYWLPQVATAVTVVEVVGSNVPGADKRATVLAYLSDVAKRTNTPWGHDVVAAIAGLVDTVVAIMNLMAAFRGRVSVMEEELELPPIEELRENVARAMDNDEALDSFLRATSHYDDVKVP